MGDRIVQETAVTFRCGADTVFGILHLPNSALNRGVLIVVGGPQYRVGSHRQFLLLARDLATQGVPVMRFDFRGMGDSEGHRRKFNEIDDDIRSAVNAFFRGRPELKDVVIWGLCDAASAALFYAYQDQRVRGLVLLNPWVHTEKGAATVYVKTYYLRRLFSPDLWRKIGRMEFNYLEAVSSFLSNLGKTVSLRDRLKEWFCPLVNRIKRLSQSNNSTESAASSKSFSLTPGKSRTAAIAEQSNLPDRMRSCLEVFNYPVLIILSGNDFTAGEFRELINNSAEWSQLISDPRITIHELDDADHTFSTRKWSKQVATWTFEWVNL